MWRVEELTINYRTPARIAAMADRVLAAMDRGLTAPRAVRDGEHDPAAHAVADAVAGTVGVVHALRDEPGRTVVVALPGLVGRITVALRDAGVDASAGLRGLETGAGIASFTVPRFDHHRSDHPLNANTVVVVEPADLLDRPTGLADLYVALTRATSRLELVHARPLPPLLVTPSVPEPLA